ncbi:MAG: hypothetical protein AAF744_15725 [Pseudomonadota bacterium]
MSDDPPIVTPYAPQLTAAVEAVYAAFGEGHVSRQLEVCFCPVCMTEETRAKIIATPTRQMPSALIQEYSNSAHGTPHQTDDLRLLLPRYLDLMAQDVEVDYVGVGTELLRFGDAVRAQPALWSDAQWEALNAWAHLMVLHFGHAEAMEMENINNPTGLLETLLTGGWDMKTVGGAFEALFAAPDVGQKALAQFAARLGRGMKTKRSKARLNLFAIRYLDEPGRAALADWLNTEALMMSLADAATDPALPEPDSTYALILLDGTGTFSADSFPARNDPV